MRWLVALVVACAGTTPAPAITKPACEGDLACHEAFAAAMCACKDSACAEAIDQELSAWAATRPVTRQDPAVRAAMHRASHCFEQLLSPGGEI